MLDNLIHNEVQGRLDARPPIPTRRGGSCLGCFGSCLGSLLGTILFVLVLSPLILVVFAPWAFFLGGNFHPFPGWSGWGKLHEPSGNILMYVSMYPTTDKSLGYPSVAGDAYLCTPQGKMLRMVLGGNFTVKHFGFDDNNQPMYLYLLYRPLLSGVFTPARYPEIKLYGTWQNPDLVMEDHGSTAIALLPDGSDFVSSSQNLPPAGASLPITFAPGNWSSFKAACHSTP
jgi:hypothetical protein